MKGDNGMVCSLDHGAGLDSVCTWGWEEGGVELGWVGVDWVCQSCQ